MTEPVPASSPSLGASFGAIAAGLFLGGFGFLAATAQGMAAAPSRWAGLAPMAIMAAGLALALLGLASLAVPHLRPAAKKSTVAALIVLAGLFLLSRFLMIAGLSDG